MRIWIISDTHFNHSKICEYEDRPTDFKKKVIKNCNYLLSPEDILIHLGDVIFKQSSELTTILSGIPAKRKYLVRGNHDRGSDAWYLNHGFDCVFNYFVINNIIFSHRPIDFSSLPMIEYNIHGHFHRRDRSDKNRKKDDYPFYTDKHILFSLEEEDYKPVLLDELIRKYSK